MALFNCIKRFFYRSDSLCMLPLDYCYGKSNQELIRSLKIPNLSLSSGNMIVVELLQRLTDQ